MAWLTGCSVSFLTKLQLPKIWEKEDKCEQVKVWERWQDWFERYGNGDPIQHFRHVQAVIITAY